MNALLVIEMQKPNNMERVILQFVGKGNDCD